MVSGGRTLILTLHKILSNTKLLNSLAQISNEVKIHMEKCNQNIRPNNKKYPNFCNIIFKGLKLEDLFSRRKDDINVIVPCNSELIVKAQNNERFRNFINKNIATFDGQIPYLLFKLKNRDIQVEKLSGSDLIYEFCKFAKENNKKVFLLGGYPESNKLSVGKLKKIYGIKVEGYSPPYEPYPFSKKNNEEILKRIENFKPHILFCAFGAMKQEFWIEDNLEFLKSIGVEYTMGVGGSFDFVSGRIKRAPKIIQKLGLEGVWRLIMEPKWFRLKRIFISLSIFYYFFKWEVLNDRKI